MRVIALPLCLLLAYAGLIAEENDEQRAPKTDIGASRLYDQAIELLLVKDKERGLKMLETVIERYPDSPLKYKAWLALGKHSFEENKYSDALNYFAYLNVMEKPDEELKGDAREVFLEGLYLVGASYYQLRQYDRAFSVLRKITNNYPSTVWASQSYYYIGMCHFAQSNWNKAIDALSMVGTFIDHDSPTVGYVEAGRRFYIKINDGDLPVLNRLGKEVTVEVQSSRGDKERIVCVPMASKAEIFIGSVQTEIGLPKAGDNVLQVLGGDTLAAHYVDDNTSSGEKDVLRKCAAKVVSTARLGFMLGNFEDAASAAFIGQPLFAMLNDADRDTTPQADSVAVRLVSRYKAPEEEDQPVTVDPGKASRPEEERWIIRDEITLTLKESGNDPVYGGKFTGNVLIDAFAPGQQVDRNDTKFTCAIGDEVIATYIDERHISGEQSREVTARVKIVGNIENRPKATQYVVVDPIVRARKDIVEARAFLELGSIFKGMGLIEGAKEKANEGLEHAVAIVRTRDGVPSSLKEEAYELKWELELVKDDFPSAMATCQLFNRLFPGSPKVDKAMMGMGMSKKEVKGYREAIDVFKRVLALPQSQAKAEAQYRIAECIELENQALAATGKTELNKTIAVPYYKACAEKYPESPFASESLARVVDYYLDTKDFAQADDLLTQIFNDYPDAGFLDRMLMKWVIVADRMGDHTKSLSKCNQLIFEYPSSPFVSEARSMLPTLQKRANIKVEGQIKDEAEPLNPQKLPNTEVKKQN